MVHILAATERACAKLFASSSLTASYTSSNGRPSFNIYCGLDNQEKEAPAIVVYAQSATEEIPHSGIWRVKTDLAVAEMAADTNVTSSFAFDVFNAFVNDNTKTVLGNYPGYQCYDVIPDDSTMVPEGDAWIQSMRFDVICILT